MTLREKLKAISPAPLPDAFIESIGDEVDVDINADICDIDREDKYSAMARVYLYLATLPNISEGGVSVSFSSEEKSLYKKLAKRYANLAGESGFIPEATYGYKGENL